MVIADTGFWLALANQCDKHHEAAKRCLEDLREPLITTWPVMTETCHLLLHRLGEKAQRAFIHSYVNGAFQVFDLSHADASPIESYMTKKRQTAHGPGRRVISGLGGPPGPGPDLVDRYPGFPNLPLETASSFRESPLVRAVVGSLGMPSEANEPTVGRGGSKS